MIFLDPFWDINNLSKRSTGFAAVLKSVYEMGTEEASKEGPFSITVFQRHHAIASDILCNLGFALGGVDFLNVVTQFLQECPASLLPP